MLREIIINFADDETRAALLEDGTAVEFFIERSDSQRLVGNIYQGKVENVLPGMQAAFINIGLEKNAFLYVEDAVASRSPGHDEGRSVLGDVNISDFLKRGQDIMVQIIKDPIGTKGPRVTRYITLPGRYLVLMPTVEYVGVSRRIENEKERERLKALGEKVREDNLGLIVRTMASGATEEELRQDFQLLYKLWKKVILRSENGSVPNLLHRDLELIQRILRDTFTENIERLTIDSRFGYEKILDLLDITGSDMKIKVVLDDREDIFNHYGLDEELDRALRRKVWLKCGGYIVIDQTEALTVIDVNTGKFVGSTTHLEDTVLKANLEAAVEISRQLRLRNIGGIIVVDFIDMLEEEHRRQVLQILEDETRKDRTKVNILGITHLGLVEMTRKKTRFSLSEVLQKQCPYCEGKGKVLSEETMSIYFKNQIQQLARSTPADDILVEANPLVAARLIGSGGINLRDLEQRTGKNVYIRGSQGQHIESVMVRPLYDNEQVNQKNVVAVKPGQVLELRILEPHSANLKDGIARKDGFIIDVLNAGSLVGEIVTVKIIEVFRTYAKASLVYV